MPISRLFWVSRRTICTQRKSRRLSTTLIRPGLPRHLHILGGHDDRAVLVAQARQRFIIAQLALRQADDRLQIEIDAIFFQRRADGLEQLALLAQAVEIGGSRPALGPGCFLRHGSGGVGNPSGKIAHQAFQHFQLGDDLLFLGQAALFELAADLAQPRAGFMQRCLEFQMALSADERVPWRHCACRGAARNPPAAAARRQNPGARTKSPPASR